MFIGSFLGAIIGMTGAVVGGVATLATAIAIPARILTNLDIEQMTDLILDPEDLLERLEKFSKYTDSKITVDNFEIFIQMTENLQNKHKLLSASDEKGKEKILKIWENNFILGGIYEILYNSTDESEDSEKYFKEMIEKYFYVNLIISKLLLSDLEKQKVENYFLGQNKILRNNIYSYCIALNELFLILKNQGFNKKKISETLSLRYSTISDYQQGRSIISPSHLFKMVSLSESKSEILKSSVEDILKFYSIFSLFKDVEVKKGYLDLFEIKKSIFEIELPPKILPRKIENIFVFGQAIKSVEYISSENYSSEDLILFTYNERECIGKLKKIEEKSFLVDVGSQGIYSQDEIQIIGKIVKLNLD